MKSWWNKESNETKIEWFGINIREKSLFENQKKSALKFGRKDEFYDFQTLITYTNLI